MDCELRGKLQEAWGAPVYDNYGSHETGMIASECMFQDRKHIYEDTVYIEFADVDTGAPLPWGERGNVVATSLYRNVPPIIRYNLRDCLIGSERERCASRKAIGQAAVCNSRAFRVRSIWFATRSNSAGSSG